MSSALSQWEIYRFELVFLNPEENRWQMFQEAVSQSGGSTASQPNQGGGENDVGATYRKQAQELLTWVREAVTKEIHRSPHSKITARKTLDTVNIDVTAMKEQLKRLCSDDFDKFIKRAIATTENTLESQGLSAGPQGGLKPEWKDHRFREVKLNNLKYLGFNMGAKPWGESVELRRRVEQALNREEIVRELFKGKARVTTSIIPEGVAGFQQ